jgi:hypothetical protein
MSIPTSTAMKLAISPQNYVDRLFTECHSNQSVNVRNKDRNVFPPLSIAGSLSVINFLKFDRKCY